MRTNSHNSIRILFNTGLRSAGLIFLTGFLLGQLSGCGGGSSTASPPPSPPASTTFTVGGTVTGLSGTGLVLQNNGSDNLTINTSGTFTFATAVASGGSYAVTVLTPVTGQTCTVDNGTGLNVTGNITNVAVICSSIAYTVSGSVTGLLAGQSVTLENNGANPTNVASNTSFTFSTPVAYGGSYAVTVTGQPVGQDCAVSNGSMSQVTADVSNVVVSCGPATYTNLPAFGATSADAINPANNIVLAKDGNFYGTSTSGGANNKGALFKVTPAGVESVLYSFSSSGPAGFNPDYNSGLIIGSDGDFYGTTYLDGASGCGSVFKATAAGVVTALHTFTGTVSDGCNPHGKLVLGSDGNYYGVTYSGGLNNQGTVFMVTPAGAESVLHSFGTGRDGIFPMAGLVEYNPGQFYGVAESGGANSNGAIFTVTTAGVENVVYSFAGFPIDGSNPYSGLTLGSDGNFYGVTEFGGTQGLGTVFKITPNGVETVVHSFVGGTADGSLPNGSDLVQGLDHNFYSMTKSGGASGDGVLYKITPAGDVTLLHSFAGGADGSAPTSSVLIAKDGYVYGTVFGGGANSGVIFFRY